jgi:hypothetical protein
MLVKIKNHKCPSGRGRGSSFVQILEGLNEELPFSFTRMTVIYTDGKGVLRWGNNSAKGLRQETV